MDRDLQRESDLAEMPIGAVRHSDLTGATALVPRHVGIADGNLIYGSQDCELKRIRIVGKLLDRFTQLWKKDDAAIVGLAARYGVLELDEAIGFRPAKDAKAHAALWGKGKGSIPFPKTGREPLSTWRDYSRKFYALLMISAKLHQEESGPPDEWKVFAPRFRAGQWSVDEQKLLVEQQIGEWVLQSNLHPVLKWSGHGPAIVFGLEDTAGLFAALVFRLMLAVAKVNGLAICAGCQTEFSPEAKARRGKDRFCKECRRNGSAHRVAQQNYAKRKKERDLNGGR